MAIQAPGMDQYVIRLVCLAAGMFAGMAAGVYVHELGHQAACVYLGYESGGITIDMSKSSHTCVFDGIVPSMRVWFVEAAGGGLAAAVFGTALAAFLLCMRGRGVMRLNGLVLYFVLAGFVSQSINFVMEAGLNGMYNETMRTLGVACSVFLVCCIWYVRLPRRSPGRGVWGRIRRRPPGSPSN